MIKRRIGPLLSLEEDGIARLIFAPDFSSFRGVLVNRVDETISLRGSTRPPLPALSPSSSSTTRMDIFLTDGASGHQYHLKDIAVEITSPPSSFAHVTIAASAISFRTSKVLIGNRADVEIQEFMTPGQAIAGGLLHVGEMRVRVQAYLPTQTTPRRESTCCEIGNIVVIEQSEDFLA